MDSSPPITNASTPITPPETPKTVPGKDGKRKIGFAPLKIPPPTGFGPQTPGRGLDPVRSPGSLSLRPGNLQVNSATPNPYVYPRKYSQYMFNQFNEIKGLGLGIGEKCSVWLYNQVSKLSKSWFTHILLTIIIVVYTVGGAFIFLTVEGTNRSVQDSDLRKERYAVLEDIVNLIEIRKDRTDAEFIGLASSRLDEYENFVIGKYKENTLLKERTWTFWNAVFFCSTIYTTIGYGHMFPTTQTGKGLTILYALIGIPLFLIILTDFGKLFTRCIKYVWSFVRRLYYTGRCRNARKAAAHAELFKGAQMMYDKALGTSQKSDNLSQLEGGEVGIESGGATPSTPGPSHYDIDDEFNLPISLALSILVLYIVLGAAGFKILEQWDFFSSFYFVFISLSTIGLGDYVPSTNMFMILTIVYLVFGLALMSMCINVVQAKLSDTFKHASAKIGATIGLDIDQDDGSLAAVPPDKVEIASVHRSRTPTPERHKRSPETIEAIDVRAKPESDKSRAKTPEANGEKKEKKDKKDKKDS